MADREKKEGKTKIQKLEYFENEKSFLDEMKNISHSFWRIALQKPWEMFFISSKKLFGEKLKNC